MGKIGHALYIIGAYSTGWALKVIGLLIGQEYPGPEAVGQNIIDANGKIIFENVKVVEIFSAYDCTIGKYAGAALLQLENGVWKIIS